MAKIHAQAVVSRKARLDGDVYVGPFSVVKDDVEIGSGTRIESHAVINDGTRLGRDNQIFPYATLGDAPNDLKYGGEKTYLTVGDNNSFRENCVVHRGTVQDEGNTIVGNNNLIMAQAHIAHDCQVHNFSILGYSSALAGHVTVCDHAVLSGGAMVVQHRSIGAHAYVTPGTIVRNHVPAFVLTDGFARTINTIGLQRCGFSRERIERIRTAYKILYMRGLTMSESVSAIKELGDFEDMKTFLASIVHDDGLPIVRPRASRDH